MLFRHDADGHGVGPLLLTRYVVGNIEWPQCWHWIILQHVWGGPLSSQKDVVDSHEWALRLCLAMWAMTLDRASASAEPYCQWLGVGPLFPTINFVDSLELA